MLAKILVLGYFLVYNVSVLPKFFLILTTYLLLFCTVYFYLFSSSGTEECCWYGNWSLLLFTLAFGSFHLLIPTFRPTLLRLSASAKCPPAPLQALLRTFSWKIAMIVPGRATWLLAGVLTGRLTMLAPCIKLQIFPLESFLGRR